MSICPCSAGMRKRPWQVPSSSSNIVKVVRRSAFASSASSALPSNFSARSGAITSKIRPPRIRSAFASWCSAKATRWVSAAPRCSVSTANSPVVGSLSSAATIARAWAMLTLPSAIAAGQHVVALQCLGEAEVGAGVAADLPRLDRDPVGGCAGTGVGGGTGTVGLGEEAELERLQLSPCLAEGGQGLTLLVGPHRPERCLGHRVETFTQPVGEVEHRVEAVDRLAAHESIQAPSTDRKGPLTCGFAHSVRQLGK